MTREEAIRILDPETTGEALVEIEYYNGFSGKTAALQAVSDACVLAVAALREQEERRWIPVTERLPERTFPPHDVLVYHNLGNGMFVDKAWFSNEQNSWHSLFGVKLKVTHWMPLPEPPKEDSNGET